MWWLCHKLINSKLCHCGSHFVHGNRCLLLQLLFFSAVCRNLTSPLSHLNESKKKKIVECHKILWLITECKGKQCAFIPPPTLSPTNPQPNKNQIKTHLTGPLPTFPPILDLKINMKKKTLGIFFILKPQVCLYVVHWVRVAIKSSHLNLSYKNYLQKIERR